MHFNFNLCMVIDFCEKGGDYYLFLKSLHLYILIHKELGVTCI